MELDSVPGISWAGLNGSEFLSPRYFTCGEISGVTRGVTHPLTSPVVYAATLGELYSRKRQCAQPLRPYNPWLKCVHFKSKICPLSCRRTVARNVVEIRKMQWGVSVFAYIFQWKKLALPYTPLLFTPRFIIYILLL
jgi:hypothetical protein